MAQGFATELWTLPRIGKLIERLFARPYSASQVWRILVVMRVTLYVMRNVAYARATR